MPVSESEKVKLRESHFEDCFEKLPNGKKVRACGAQESAKSGSERERDPSNLRSIKEMPFKWTYSAWSILYPQRPTVIELDSLKAL